MGTKIHRRKGELAFYELPQSVRSSAEIISEARIEMAAKRTGMVAMAPGGIRAVDTKRPFTPRESQRTLFGRAGRVGVSRPPSAVSLKYLQTEKIYGEALKPVPWLITKPPRQVQRTTIKHSEIMSLPITPMSLSRCNTHRVKLPDLPQPVPQELKSSRLIRLQFHAASLVNLPEEDEEKYFEPAEKSQILCKTHSFESRSQEKRHVKVAEKKIKIDAGKISEALLKEKQNNDILEQQAEKTKEDDINSHLMGKSFSPKCSQEPVLKSVEQSASVSINGNLSLSTCFTCSSNNPKTNGSDVICLTKELFRGTPYCHEYEARNNPFDQIVELTQLLNLESANENNEPKVITLLQNLYEVLDSNNLVGSKLSSKTKAQILRSLYKFVERSSNELLLEVAHIILTLCVSGSNLAGVCKLIFKVSRSDKNDYLFLQGNILELFINALGTAEPMEDAEACIYGYGALKFLTMNSVLLNKLLSFGALELMVLHMKVITKWKMEGGIISEQTSHALFQLTGALRNIAGEEEEPFPIAFVSSGIINELCNTIYLFSCDLDIICNVSRTLSILSTHDICCDAIMDHENSIKTLVKLLKKFPGRQDVVVRICYVLGNILAKSDNARLKFYYEEDALPCLTELLLKYMHMYSSVSLGDNGNVLASHTPATSNLVDDVLIKVVRVIANMSISPTVGLSIVGHNEEENNSETCGQILDALLTILRNREVNDSPELIVSLLATLNNLTFWAVGVENGEFSKRQIEVAEVLHSFTMEDHKESLIEAIRVFGNLTQSKEVREYTVENGILEKLLQLLERPVDFSKDLLLANVGILVNMMADPDKRRIFASHCGISRLIEILENTNGRNWNLSSLICQVIWNYIIESQDIYSDLGKSETDKLVSILADYLDEEHYFGVPEGSEMDPAISMTSAYQEWEEFATVATDLLEKIEEYLDSFHINAVFIEENALYHS